MSHVVGSVHNPAALATLSAAQWETVLALGRAVRLSGRWYDQLAASGAVENVPPAVVRHLWADRLIAEENDRRVRWEADRVHHALRGLNVDVVLLKGGAYALASLAAGNKRLTSDLDILVPQSMLDGVEAAIGEAGWRISVDNDYDESYYRQWMHELPPFRHQTRGTWLDVHHNIAPLTSARCPDANSLLSRAVRIGDTPYYSLSPTDMLIHSIYHGFYTGEFLSAFRDVLDIHELVSEFSTNPQFWETFHERCRELRVGPPVYYALNTARRIFSTELPDEVEKVLREHRPVFISRSLVDGAIRCVANAAPIEKPSLLHRMSAKFLLARSHLMKMPMTLLFGHLSRKLIKRLTTPDPNPTVAG